jgi:hypothetical protein
MPDRGRSKRKVLLAITIAQQADYRGIVRFAREHDWHLRARQRTRSVSA